MTTNTDDGVGVGGSMSSSNQTADSRVARERVKKKGLLLGIKSPFKFGSSMKKREEEPNISNGVNSGRSGNSGNGVIAARQQAVEVVATKGQHQQQHGRQPEEGSKQEKCAGCGQRLGDGHALMAMDTQFHVWCFKCAECGTVLQGEYMGKEGKPYCEKCYQGKFGVKCTYCGRFISGKVLQAGNNNHFHPTCARCTKCGDPFGDGEEMFLQGAAIWHPRCGPGPDEPAGSADFAPFPVGSSASALGDHPDDATSVASGPFLASRASSPGASLRRGDAHYGSGRFSRSTTHMSGWSGTGLDSGAHPRAMYTAASCYSLRRPLEPGDRMDSLSSIPHFHLPPSRRRHNPLSSASSMGLSRAPSAATALQQSAHGASTPRPGYTSDLRARSAISPGPGMHFGDYESTIGDDSASRSYSAYGAIPPVGSTSNPAAALARNPIPSRPRTPHANFALGEHKIYALHVLLTTNYKLPPDVDRCNLEKHLCDEDFEFAFGVARRDFYRLPTWRRNEMKKRVHLF